MSLFRVLSSLGQRLVGPLVVTALLLGRVLPAAADALLPVNAAASHTLVGNSAGAIDSYSFTVPQPVTAPTVTAEFTPSLASDGGQAGFQVFLNGTNLAAGARTATPGEVQYTLPQNPSGVVVIQVFNYSSASVTFHLMASGVPASVPNGPARAGSSKEQPVSLNGSLDGSLPGNPSGSFAYFTFPSAGASPPTTVSLTYAPANALVNQAVGFNVVDSYGNTIASATQPNGQNLTAATLSVDLSRTPGEALSVQVFNYAQDVTVTYRLSISGIPPLAAAPPASPPAPAATSPVAGAFSPFWVENFVATPLWSGPDQRAVSFGVQPQFSSYLVARAQAGPRLYVFNPRTHDYAYIDASAVGPSGPPR